MICICRQNLKLPQDSLVKNKPPLLCDCFCGRYDPNKAALQAHCLACNSLPTDGFCTATCFVFVHLSSCFPFFGELKMRNFHTHTNIMWAHLCAIKPCFVFVKVLTQEQIRLLSSALSRQTATGTNCLLLRFDIQLERDTETKEAWSGLYPSFTQTHTLIHG